MKAKIILVAFAVIIATTCGNKYGEQALEKALAAECKNYELQFITFTDTVFVKNLTA